MRGVAAAAAAKTIQTCALPISPSGHMSSQVAGLQKECAGPADKNFPGHLPGTVFMSN